MIDRAKLGLNIGAGNHPMADDDELKWLNLEPFYTGEHTDADKGLIGRYNMFPIKAQDILDYLAGDSFDVIYIVHCLEHLASKDAEELLKDCWHLLRPDGYLEVETPDLDKACRLWLAGDQSKRVMGLFYGDDHENPGQQHQTGFNLTRYQNLLDEYGYQKIEEIEVGEGHDRSEPEYDIRIRAFKT